MWRAARELAGDRERWAVRVRCERGYTEQLPDLAVWLRCSAPPVALIAESGGRREDRQKLILDGWRDAIMCGRYAAVRYDCASESVACWINRLATKVRLPASVFSAGAQMSAGEIAALSPAAPKDKQPVEDQQASGDRRRECEEAAPTPPVRAPTPAEPVSMYAGDARGTTAT